jgi:hypothetical protein
MNFRQKLIIAGLDVLILAELTFAVYKSMQGPPDDLAGAFLRLFAPALLLFFHLTVFFHYPDVKPIFEPRYGGFHDSRFFQASSEFK